MIRAIGQVIGSMVKLDSHTNSGRLGRFARLVVCVDLKKPLVSKIKINGRLQ